jgi:glycosyltransferase involved in cell wall biosynthesis
MRIGIHADPAAHSVPGGVGVYVRRLIDELLADPQGDELKLIVSRFANPPAAWATTSLVRPQLPFAALYAAWNFLGKPGVDGSLDVIHATGLAIPPAVGAALVSTIHDLAVETMPEVVPFPWRQIYKKGLTRALDQSAVICAVSEATKAAIIAAHGTDPDRILVTPEAANVTPASTADDRIFDKLTLAGPYVLNVGTVEPRKNQVRLVKAFASAGKELEDHSLVLAGIPGWGQEQVADAVEALSVGHRVIFTDKVTNLELASLYSRASIFALPSLYEGFGIPLVEAMSFGIPSVAGSTPALAELGGDATLLVDPRSTEELAGALVQLATDQALRDRLTVAAEARAAGYTWANTARLTRAAYERAAG